MSSTTKTIRIMHCVDGSVLWEGPAATIKDAIHAAIAACVDLRYAYLQHAELQHLDLRYVDLQYSDLRSADLRHADLRCSNLQHADLRYGDLRHVDLRCSNLQHADLRCVDLRCVDLRYSDLQHAKGLDAARITPLLMLLDQPGQIRAYKLVTAAGFGPFNSGVKYDIGAAVSVDDANTDPLRQCASGINVATLDWCLANYSPGNRVLIVEFTAQDIACIPTATDGKFRLHRCRVVAEKNISALVAPATEVAA